MHSPAMAMAFSLFLLCFITCTLCGIVLFFKSKQINAALKHPYLQHRPFKQYPLSIQAAIMLDYFFRLMFPGTRFWRSTSSSWTRSRPRTLAQPNRRCSST